MYLVLYRCCLLMCLAHFTNRKDEDSSHDFSNDIIRGRGCDGFRRVVYHHKGIHDAIEGATLRIVGLS